MLKYQFPDERNIASTSLDLPLEFNVRSYKKSQPTYLGNKIVTTSSPTDDPLTQNFHKNFYIVNEGQNNISKGHDIL